MRDICPICSRRKWGVNFTDYLNQRRVHLAMCLIREGVRSVSALADACGFENPYYFSKVFKGITGKAPSKWFGGEWHAPHPDPRIRPRP